MSDEQPIFTIPKLILLVLCTFLGIPLFFLITIQSVMTNDWFGLFYGIIPAAMIGIGWYNFIMLKRRKKPK